ncbi:MAG TPA: hypothetical protein VMU54_25710 [Planctomycetota bacterium]|nr:hypothetical protein [Planctomycetota bacterium]
MTIMEFVLLLVLAGFAGALGQAIAGYSRGGCLVSIALGFIGALLGGWLSRSLGIGSILLVRLGDQPFPLDWSIAGATLFVAIVGFISRSRRRKPPLK